ncbi:PIG-L deacetylase family protein [Dyella soli]|uniref:PIG-L family deacetylase n=1 Tax=Dyella soli TaxID=522319 RepID=A0A4R0YPQ7_9GAMM|nr:PIG-L family deacetylase [Dyella soli]TCI09875.1 PIG-L family deacetylase [Dyella soli]
MALSLNARTRLLVVSPHPDDESIATGELIQQVREAGGEVRILLLTNGDNNPWPQRWVERRLRIGAAERRRWGERRRGEVGQALGQLGVDPSALQALGWPDMGLTSKLCNDFVAARQAVGACLDAFRPSLVALPALGDHHPDHGAAHVLTRLALASRQGAPPELLAYLVHGREGEVTGRVKLDSSVGMHANKLTALACHRSQMALSGKRMRRLADRPERYQVVREPHAGPLATVLPWQPSAALRPWLRLTVADGEAVRTWPWSRAPVTRDGQGHYVLHALAEGHVGPVFAKLHMYLPSPWIFDRWGWCEL